MVCHSILWAQPFGLPLLVEPRSPPIPLDLSTWRTTRASELCSDESSLFQAWPSTSFQSQGWQTLGGTSSSKVPSAKSVTKENVEVLRADLEHKVWVVKGDQWEPGLRALVGNDDSSSPSSYWTYFECPTHSRDLAIKNESNLGLVAPAPCSPWFRLDENAVWWTQHRELDCKDRLLDLNQRMCVRGVCDGQDRSPAFSSQQLAC